MFNAKHIVLFAFFLLTTFSTSVAADAEAVFREVDKPEVSDSLLAFFNPDQNPEASRIVSINESNKLEQLGDNDTIPEMGVTERSRKKKFLIWIVLAAQTNARLFHNQYYVGSVTRWNRKDVFPIRVKYGDSIEIISTGTKKYHGVVALIKVGHKRFVTGGRGKKHFKTIVAKSVGTMTHKNWATPRFNSCNWFMPVPLKPQPQKLGRRPHHKGVRYAKRFPFSSGAKYVWAPYESEGSTIYMRFVVGGEKCPSPTPTTSPKPSPNRGAKRCACKQVSVSLGDCFQYYNSRFKNMLWKRGRCKRRPCVAKYECTEPGVQSKTLCVRRFTKLEVQQVGRVFRGLCKTVRIKPTPFYVPYTGVQ